MSAKETLERERRRIVACVAACAGLSTEALEAGVVGELMEALAELLEGIQADHRIKRGDYYHPRERSRRVIALAKGESP